MRYLELTREEIHIFKILVENSTKTNEEIGAELIRSPHTIAAHVRSILSKLGLKSRHELLHYALKNGLYDVKSKNGETNREWNGM